MAGFTSGCGIASNSGLSITGVGSMTTLATTYVGSYSISNGGTPSQPPTHVATTTADPLSGLQAPSYTSHCDHSGYSSNASPLNPGTYCNGLEIGNATSFTFNSGVYIINGGYLDLTGATTVTGSGVTFFVTGGKYSQPALNGISWSNINNL